MMQKDKTLFEKFKSGLRKTSSGIASIFTGNKIDEETWELLEERMISADIGSSLVDELIALCKSERNALKTPETLLHAMKKHASAFFPKAKSTEGVSSPIVTLVIGVNGAGKTTTIAKMGKSYANSGKKILLCAADTFRAAAIDQLKHWGENIGVDVFASNENADPSSVAYESITLGISKKYDRVIIDTAGRLHTKHNLMEELKKMYRVASKAKAGAPDEVLLVLDGTTGQNALNQAKVFNGAVPVSSVVITKLDGTAKGGIVLNIARQLQIPVKYVGFGEKEGDLMEFDPEAYVEAIFSL